MPNPTGSVRTTVTATGSSGVSLARATTGGATGFAIAGAHGAPAGNIVLTARSGAARGSRTKSRAGNCAGFAATVGGIGSCAGFAAIVGGTGRCGTARTVSDATIVVGGTLRWTPSDPRQRYRRDRTELILGWWDAVANTAEPYHPSPVMAGHVSPLSGGRIQRFHPPVRSVAEGASFTANTAESVVHIFCTV